MELTIYDIIKGPWITEKGYRLNSQLRQLVLEVHVKANKPQIAEALRKLFNVEVDAIRVIVRKGKIRRVGRRIVVGKTAKKAIVRLKEGYSLDVMGAQGIPQTEIAPAA